MLCRRSGASGNDIHLLPAFREVLLVPLSNQGAMGVKVLGGPKFNHLYLRYVLDLHLLRDKSAFSGAAKDAAGDLP